MCTKLSVAIVIGLSLCVITVMSNCRANFNFQRVCPMTYGSVLSYIHDTQSTQSCSHACNSDDECRSWVYDPGTKVCETNSRTEEVTSFPGSCGSTVVWGKLEKATCRDTWLENACLDDSNCTVPYSMCHNDACRCADGYAYMYRTDSCMSECMEYGSTYKEEYYYISLHNIYRLTTTLNDCLNDCATKYPTCRMVEYDFSQTLCDLQEATALTNPDELYYEYEAAWVQFLRNCY